MNTKTYWGLLAGLATGFVAGVLIAPKSGKDILADISGTTNNWRGQIRDQWDRLIGGQSGGAQARNIQELEKHREEMVHADFNNPDDLPHRPRV